MDKLYVGSVHTLASSTINTNTIVQASSSSMHTFLLLTHVNSMHNMHIYA